jgi:hypothetical protein
VRQVRDPARRLPLGGLALLDVRTERRISVPWGETATIGRNAASDRHVHVDDDQVSRVAAEIEIRDDAYLVINRQRHGGQLTLLVPGVAGQDRIREGNGLLVRDSRASLGLWLSDGREVTLALLAFGPTGGHVEAPDLAGGVTVNAALPTDETWWSVLVAACGPTLIAAARSPEGAGSPSLRSPQHVHGDADQIAAWHREAGRPAPRPAVVARGASQRQDARVARRGRRPGDRSAAGHPRRRPPAVPRAGARRPARSAVRSPPRPAGPDGSPHRGSVA